jgi:gentisate 1,2-dioxygenase
MTQADRRSALAIGLAVASAAMVKPAAAIIQPGSKTPENQVMMNAMVCHITEGELRVVQDGKTFTAKKDFVWTCNKDTIEHSANDGRVVAIMRITDLKASDWS